MNFVSTHELLHRASPERNARFPFLNEHTLVDSLSFAEISRYISPGSYAFVFPSSTNHRRQDLSYRGGKFRPRREIVVPVFFLLCWWELLRVTLSDIQFFAIEFFSTRRMNRREERSSEKIQSIEKRERVRLFHHHRKRARTFERAYSLAGSENRCRSKLVN